MRVRRKFIQLTKHTVPFGTETKMLKYLPKGYKKDKHGNYYVTVGRDFTTMFTCHLDTACSYEKTVNHTFNGKYIKTDGKTILGADDKAGMVVILYMIEKKVPGLYYFFVGEEVGCIGSSKLAQDFDWMDISKVVSFDRRGTTSVITEQMCGVCCSDEFAYDLSDKLNATGLGLELIPDDTGILTDSAQFVDFIPECTNISVGYYNEHTRKECQDIDFLSKLCRACTMIDWESLPVVRIPGEDEYDEMEPIMGMEHTGSNGDTYSESIYVNISENNSIRKMYLSERWVEIERRDLKNMLKGIGYSPKEVIWDGRDCWCDEGNGKGFCYIGSRQHIVHLIDDFHKIPYQYLREDLSSPLHTSKAFATIN